jgi:hypothetical protein
LVQRFISVLVLSCFAVPPASAQVTSPGEIDYETAHLSRILRAVRITGKITLDGHLDEPEWNQASPATDFTQRLPFPGKPSHERTEVRVLYDEVNPAPMRIFSFSASWTLTGICSGAARPASPV